MEETKDKEKFIAVVIHLSGCIVFSLGLAPLNILLPLFFWLTEKDNPFLNFQGREALRFQIFMTLYIFIAIPLIPFLGNIFSLEIKKMEMIFNLSVLTINPLFSATAALQALRDIPYCYPAIFSPYNPRRELLKQEKE